MTTYAVVYFRAADEAAFAAAWPELAGHPDLDAIGPVVTAPAELDPETGEETVPATIDARWHANLLVRGAAAANLFAGLDGVLGAATVAPGGDSVLYGTPPANPVRRWAGL